MIGAGGVSDLVEFSFESEVPSGGLPPSALARLARQSWSHNTRLGLTGRLAFLGDRFESTIEGPCAFVQPLAARILCDHRHGLIRIVAFQPLAKRRHAAWELEGFEFADTVFDRVDRTAKNLSFLPFAAERQPIEGTIRSVAGRSS